MRASEIGRRKQLLARRSLGPDVGLERRAQRIAESSRAGCCGSEHVERLESELRATRERLQAAIEELESANEAAKRELRSSA
ncbi:hypothetical protein JQ604_38960 [Bradyrhizobium jicamae]|uniref:hypothetical protein n=1 Tax=Bradyrhizobium jicamae TaxID=280332 RepID=UPI001BA92C3D|nr:hypothetical protein [Bradyrhizobium jicamae]MBR0758198.1 hypothetical protein [Bradyrhizobium jicamae]